MKIDDAKTREEIFEMNLGGTYTVLKNYDEESDRLLAQFFYNDEDPDADDRGSVIEVVSTPDESTVRWLDRSGETCRLVFADSGVEAMKIAHESARTN
jgi:hypothetical protein